MTPLRTTLVVSCAAALTALASCSTDSSESIAEFQGYLACKTVSDCASGDICSERYGFCFRPMPAGTALVMEIVPSPDSSQIPDQFNGVECPAPGRLDLTITPRATLSGRIVPPDGDTSDAYRGAGRLFADAPGRIPGLSFRHETRTLAGADGSTWQIPVAPDLNYKLTWVANDATVPSRTWTVGAGVSGTVNLPVDAQVFSFSGVVRRLSDQDKVPVAGAVVQVSTDGLAAASAVSDSNGIFSLSIPGTAESITIQVLSGESGLAFPVRELEWEGIDEFKADLPRTSFLAIDLDTVPDVATISFQVLSELDGGSRIPMGGSVIFLERTDGDGEFRTRSAIDRNGFSALSLPAGTYTVALLPPGGGAESGLKSREFGIKGATVAFEGETDRTFGFELSPRPILSGRVVAADDASPVSGAKVFLASDTSRIDGWRTSFVTDLVFEATTDVNGEFSTPIEAGTYSMQVKPPTGTVLATASWPEIAITGTENLRIELGGSCLLSGRLVSDDGAPLGASTLTFFQATARETWDSWPMKDDSWADAIRATGTTRTGDDGSFEILLPCPDEPSSATGGVMETW